jgi:flagellar hook protein FlgE
MRKPSVVDRLIQRTKHLNNKGRFTMLRSLYSGVTGLKSFQTKLDVIGNNVANVNTVGYKKSRVMFSDLLSQSIGSSGVGAMQVGLGTKVSTIDVLHTQGSPMQTGIATDLTLQGDGFFVVGKLVEDAQGNQQYEKYLTRAGNFYMNENRELVTSTGLKVLDHEGEPIEMPQRFEIDGAGKIIDKDDASYDVTLGYSLQPNPQALERSGDTMYFMPRGEEPSSIQAEGANATITAGRLEMSNVDLTEEFTEMIIAQRGFQSTSKIITTSDEILQEIVNLKR